MALITPALVISTASPRNIDISQIKTVDITIAENDYIKASLGNDLYAVVVAGSATTYAAFISTYVVPVLAFGVLTDIWHRLRVEITDRGINQMTGEGITTPQNDVANAALREYRQKLSSCLDAMIDYAELTYPTLFDSTLDFQYKFITYYSQTPKRVNAL